MNSKVLFFIVSITLLTISQSVLGNYIRIQGVVPNLFLIFVISCSLLFEQRQAAFVGFIVGMILDVLWAKVLGLNALIFWYFALTISHFNKKLYRESVLPAILFVSLGTLLYNFYILVMMFYLKGHAVYWDSFLKLSLTEVLYNGSMTLWMHAWMVRMHPWIGNYTKVFRRY